MVSNICQALTAGGDDGGMSDAALETLLDRTRASGGDAGRTADADGDGDAGPGGGGMLSGAGDGADGLVIDATKTAQEFDAELAAPPLSTFMVGPPPINKSPPSGSVKTPLAQCKDPSCAV